MAEPRLLMIDEMSLGLAPIVVQQLVGALDTIRGEGVAILLVEQDVYLALDSADRGYVIEMGAVVHSGQAKALIDDSAVRQAYLGL
jgi:branched-chain amino acid transport system ATP-binding protein